MDEMGEINADIINASSNQSILNNRPETFYNPNVVKIVSEQKKDNNLHGSSDGTDKLDELAELSNLNIDDKNDINLVLADTQKVVDICLTDPRFSEFFKRKFEISEGVLMGKGEGIRVVNAKTPEQLLRNFLEVSQNGNSAWMYLRSIENLQNWIGVALEANPAVIDMLAETVDLERYDVETDMLKLSRRPTVLEEIRESKYSRIPVELFTDGLRRAREELIAVYGEGFVSNIWTYGGTSRSLVTGGKLTGDLDIAITLQGVSSDTRKNVGEILRKHTGVKVIDDLTGSDGAFSGMMEKKGYSDFFAAVHGSQEFSIGKISVNLATGDIHDPYGGARDIDKGIIRLVGDVTGPETAEEKIVLALRAARFSAQYGFDIEKTSIGILNKMASGNFVQRAVMIFKGLNQESGILQTEISKTYKKMIENAQNTYLIAVALKKLGMYKFMEKTISVLNQTSQLAWGNQLRNLQDIIWNINERKLDELSGASDPRFTGELKEIPQDQSKKTFASMLALARGFAYITTGF